MESITQPKSKNAMFSRIIITIPLTLLVFFGLFYKLGYENVNVDQFLWYFRTENFFNAISQGRFKDTYQQYHPGVTLMYSIGLGNLLYSSISGGSSELENIPYMYFGLYNFCTKFFLVLFTLIALVFSAYALLLITNSKIYAYIFTLLTLFEMYYLGIVRNLHLDGLVSALVFATTTTFYLGFKKLSIKWVTISGLFMGLGLLTKSSASFAGIYGLLIFILFVISRQTNFLWYVKAMLVWVAITALVFVALFPAMWVTPILTIKRILIDGVFETGADGGFTHYVNNLRIRDPGPTFYLLVLKYRFTPLIQLLASAYVFYIPVSLIRTLKERQFKNLLTKATSFAFISLVCFLVYFVVITIASKKTDRYFSINYPFLVVVSTHSLYAMYRSVIKNKVLKTVFMLVTSVGMVYNIVNFVTLIPYGMAYYNHLWGGLSKAKKQIYLNQGGIGYFEVARFINEQDLPPDTVVGATSDTPLRHLIKFRVTQPQPKNRKVYKLVVLPLQLDEQFKHGRKLAFTFRIQGNDYWRVYYRDFTPKMLSN